MFGFKSWKERKEEKARECEELLIQEKLRTIHDLSEKYMSKPQTEQAAENFIKCYEHSKSWYHSEFWEDVTKDVEHKTYAFGLFIEWCDYYTDEMNNTINFGFIRNRPGYLQLPSDTVFSLYNDNLQMLSMMEMCAFLYAVKNKAYDKLLSACDDKFPGTELSAKEIYLDDGAGELVYGFNFEYERKNPDFKIAQAW